MKVQLAPDLPTVEPGKILNLVVKCVNGSVIHKQYLSVKSFDYGEVLEEIRQRGLIKSDDVLPALGELLIEREYVQEVQGYILDLGQEGRASSAVQDYYKHKLNANTSIVKNVVSELSKHHFEFIGPEGILHVLKVGLGIVIGHVHISVEDNTGLYETLTLDIVGPQCADFPDDFNGRIEFEMTQYLLENHPEIDIKLTVRVRRSEMTVAEDFLYDRC